MAGDEVTLGGIKIELGADEQEFDAAGKGMGNAIADAITVAMKRVVADITSATDGALEDAEGGGGIGGAAAGVGAGAGAGAGLARVGRRFGGSAVSRVAGGGGAGVLAAAGAATAATGGAALPVIIALAAAGIAVIAFVATMKKINKLLTSEADRLSGLSASLAIAAVEKTIGKLNRDLDRARVIGPIMLKITRMLERIKDRLAPLANTTLLVLAGSLSILLRVVDAIVTGAIALVDVILATAIAFVKVHAVVIRFLSNFLPFGTGALLKLLASGFDMTAEELEKIRKQILEGVEANDRNSDLNKIFAEQLATLSGRGLHDLFPKSFGPPDPFRPLEQSSKPSY